MKKRTFIKTTLLASSSIFLLPSFKHFDEREQLNAKDEKIRKLATSILEKWCMGLYANQTIEPGNKQKHGGIYSPGDEAYLGRCADAIYPFLWMAKHTGDNKYVEAAKMVYEWEQNNCWNEEYGCWYNDPGEPDGWKSISVFSAITKIEAIEHYPELLGEKTIHQWKNRLQLVAEYLYKTFHVEYANINYPATATLALYKLGKMFGEDKYTDKAKELAIGMLDYFTPEGFFFGEGGRKVNENGQYPIDLGYNVEESLPNMALYSRLANDNELYQKVINSMEVHLEFMLPNGGWDNSWGTRSFKWTLWGSRTSDGCHPGYYLLSDDNPAFAEAVYRNLKCLNACTHNNLLYSGPHEHLEKINPSAHHTFDHAKSLTSLLNIKPPKIKVQESILPREKKYGIKKYDDINTILFSKGPWSGTITGYGVVYKDKTQGHASGGALTCLYHSNIGMICASSMTEYQRWEKRNMLDKRLIKNFMNLTPRLELEIDKTIYRNISDLNPNLTSQENENNIQIRAKSRLVDIIQNDPKYGAINASINYIIHKMDLTIEVAIDRKQTGKLSYIFPLICKNTSKINLKENSIKIFDSHRTLCLESNYKLDTLIPFDQRVYNFIPGLQAFPIKINCTNIDTKKLVLKISTE